MSSREAYSLPSNTNTGYTYNNAQDSSSSGPKISYKCGDCSKTIQLNKSDLIRCPDCGYRVLYKERTKRMVQFEAR